MTLLAHAIAAAPPASLSPEGLRGRPLAWSETAGLGLWSTEWAPDIRLERSDALEHHRLVERICAVQPCLPVRFGTAFATSEEARASLDKRASALRAALTRVSGKSELALTLLWRDPSVPPATRSAEGPGRRYMERRRAEYVAREARRARAESLVERVITELAIERPLVWHETCTSDNVAASLAVLVPTERALERKAELEDVATQFTDVIPVVNGPWPPYTFARTE
ncbi:MAG: GvpL/GvpF family gas vesicle protein [Chloroflexota bacterium]|nr:GvpL/GvpF family gas vesicle protein [Chloroflexota bacterium]